MKILRLFINNDLSGPINWVTQNDNDNIETGSSSFEDLALFDDATLEVYLSTSCCSIFNTSVQGISTKRITEELVLGLIEESLVDEIDEVKAIILRVEDDIVYIAVFNRTFYESLMHELQQLNKSIKFIQSFAFTTLYKENCWTLFLSKQQRFVRTSKYEYYSLDDAKPIPILLEDMLSNKKPKSLQVYLDEDSGYNINEISNRFEIECTNVTNQYEYGVSVWNFYIQKSTSFNLKLDKVSKLSLTRLLKTVKYLAIFLVAFWLLDVLMLTIDGYRIKSQISANLKGVAISNAINHATIQMATDKINTLRHQRGIYDDRDAVVLLTKFLEIVSTITPNDIKQIEYDRGEMQIILGSRFDTGQFASYQDVLETRRVIATIEDYKAYAKKKKKSEDVANNSITDTTTQIDDAAWVITLKPALWHEAVRNE